MTLYHGTSLDAGNKIIGTQTFHASFGDEHWLGDGVYFYSDKYYVFRWIYLAYSKKYRNCVPKMENILMHYEILSAQVDLDSERIFDMSNRECYQIFKKVLKDSQEKIRNGNPKLKIKDGAVFNILFNKIGYKKRYDAIKGLFIHRDKTVPADETRFFILLKYSIVL